MNKAFPRIFPAFLSLLAFSVTGLPSHARAETTTPSENAGDPATYSWDRPATELAYTSRVAGRRIPDYLRSLLEDARELRPGIENGAPPPATLSQLRRRAEEDTKRLDEVLRSEAYYNGSVSSSVRQAEGGGFEVVYFVILGPRTMIGTFDIVYSDYPQGGEDMPRTGTDLGLKPDRAALAQRIIDLTSAAVTHLHNHGYPNAELDRRRVVVDLSSNLAAVTLHITAGPRYVFGPLLVSNTDGRTNPAYVQSLATFKEGEVFDRREVDKTTDALRETGLFSGISIEPIDPADGILPQKVELTERPHRTVRLGANWSSSEGAGVRGSWEHRNLFGEAEKLTLGLTIAQIAQAATADFRKPNFLRNDQSLLASFEIAHEENDAYKEDRIKTGVSLERVLTERWTGNAGVTFQITETEDSTGRYTYQLFGVPVGLRYDSANDLFDPTSGIRAALGVTPYFGASDGKASAFTRVEASAATYLGLMDDLTLALRGRYGSIFAGETEDVPGSTRFYSGGGGSVRGYGYQLAGPLDNKGDPIGGRSVLEANVEARYKFTETIGMVAFVDGGQAYENMAPSFSDELLWGAGLGVRYYTPIGPVRADVAIPLNKRGGVDDAFQIYLSLGQAF